MAEKQEDIPIIQLLEESLAIKSVLAERFGITLEARLEDPLAVLSGDRRLLRAAVGNLIDEAIRNGRAGKKVLVNQRTEGTGVVINVIRPPSGRRPRAAGSGSGGRIDAGTKRDGGNGGQSPGMTLARRVAELHGGRIVSCTAEGGGSSCALHLPLRRRGTALGHVS
mgnify:CR=1 FL=1